QVTAMWFGPKGFASVVYSLLVLKSGIAAADEVFHLVALTVVLSILAHSSTDILVAKLFDDPEKLPAWFGRLRARTTGRPAVRAGSPELAEPPATAEPPGPAATTEPTGDGTAEPAGEGTAEPAAPAQALPPERPPSPRRSPEVPTTAPPDE